MAENRQSIIYVAVWRDDFNGYTEIETQQCDELAAAQKLADEYNGAVVKLSRTTTDKAEIVEG